MQTGFCKVASVFGRAYSTSPLKHFEFQPHLLYSGPDLRPTYKHVPWVSPTLIII